MISKKMSKFTTISASKRLMASMEVAINNMIEEVKKPVDPEAGGSARKAELQSIKQTAIDCKELLIERQRLEQMVKELQDNGSIEKEKDYSGGFAEKFSNSPSGLIYWDDYDFDNQDNTAGYLKITYAPVAQLDRASAF